MEYLAGAVAVLAALAFVAYPLVRRAAATAPPVESTESYAERRTAVYRELLELEFDHRVGKLSNEDFRQLADACLARAAALVAAEEQMAEALDACIEREVAAMRMAMQARSAANEGARTA
ncbi:MAG: hypothetical protein M3O34_05960 [Chloroflexota bacterium]|nr:hypothetical protein [Chloroflexota bacterium]